MIDIQSYRARIGTFSQHHNKQMHHNKYASRNIRDFFVISLSVLVILGLAAICSIEDPSIESNPGPSPTFESREEGVYFNDKIDKILIMTQENIFQKKDYTERLA